VAPLESAPQSADLLVYWRREPVRPVLQLLWLHPSLSWRGKNPRSDKKIGDREIFAGKIPSIRNGKKLFDFDNFLCAENNKCLFV
jgi:hypothetical protein